MSTLSASPLEKSGALRLCGDHACVSGANLTVVTPSPSQLSHVWSSAAVGVDALPVEIETHLASGLPHYTLVGLPDGAVRESWERVRAALKMSGLPVPRCRTTVNLAPADVRKEGAAFDLPIALGLVAALSDRLPRARFDTSVILGELALDGTVRPVRGVLPATLRARRDGRTTVIVPRENAAEAAVVEGIDVYGVASLAEAHAVLAGEHGSIAPLRRRDYLLLDALVHHDVGA